MSISNNAALRFRNELNRIETLKAEINAKLAKEDWTGAHHCAMDLVDASTYLMKMIEERT